MIWLGDELIPSISGNRTLTLESTLVCVCVEHLKRCKTSTLVLCHYNEPVSSILYQAFIQSPFESQGA